MGIDLFKITINMGVEARTNNFPFLPMVGEIILKFGFKPYLKNKHIDKLFEDIYTVNNLKPLLSSLFKLYYEAVGKVKNKDKVKLED